MAVNMVLDIHYMDVMVIIRDTQAVVRPYTQIGLIDTKPNSSFFSFFNSLCVNFKNDINVLD